VGRPLRWGFEIKGGDAMKKRKSYTLMEILIVVIALAILASIFLPSFISQSENAYIVEAQRTLSILHKAEAYVLDQGLTLPALTAADTQTDMPALGLKGIPATNFTYTCEIDGASCTAFRNGDAAKGSITLSLAGVFSCDGMKYITVPGNKGCKPR